MFVPRHKKSILHNSLQLETLLNTGISVTQLTSHPHTKTTIKSLGLVLKTSEKFVDGEKYPVN